ncbi:MAG: gliding motility-associated C-terminal domain-containing protein [Ferruginibacter sp.]
MKLYLFVFICSFFCVGSFAQKQNNVWHFGYNVALDFNTNPLSVLSNSSINTFEGSASICDTSGSLLFYTDGDTVWNRNNTIMLNGTGLLGGNSSTQSALIIPLPCNSNIYYIFTTPEYESGLDTAHYSIVDMSLNGGLGEVTTKNIILHTPTVEKVNATLKANGTDYWLVLQENSTDVFLAYSFSSAGLNPTPIVSHTGQPSTVSNQGYMNFSPDGSRISCVDFDSNAATLYDFDNSTGIVSNPLPLGVSTAYGTEFSPDNSKLYVGSLYDNHIYQFDLLAGSATAIQNSKIPIATGGPFGALKLGPDNKIYVCIYLRSYISAIDQPNQAGTACNYISNVVNLAAGGILTTGLPNNLKSFSNCNTCPNASNATFNITICENQSYQLPSGISVNMEGVYSDTLRNQASCDSIINTIYLSVNDHSHTNITDSIYTGQTYVLPSGETVNSTGTYQSVLTNSQGCDSVITTTLMLRKIIDECITIKNAFTPNGDGINDYWELYRYNCFKKLEVNVYNRYGSLVYHSDDYKNDWSGKYKNKELPDGTYYYVVKVTSYDGRQHVFKNNVTILR